MKTTQLISFHEKLRAKLVEFAGYKMPLEYTGVNDEHLTVRKKVGVFDVSHMGEFWVSGEGALDFLQKITTNDVSRLVPGKAQYSCMPNGLGGIVDDLIVYHYEDKKYLLVVNAANIEKDWKWINRHNTFNAVIENASDKMSMVAVQGPEAKNVVQKLTKINLAAVKSFSFETGKVAGVDHVIISATGYTGAGGVELYCYNDGAEALWAAIFEAGADKGIKPIGLAARDTLRLEMGYCLYGNDIDDTTSPLEAGLGWITKFTEHKNFIDKEFLERQKEQGVQRKLVGIEMIERGIPRHHYSILNQQDKVIGQVTSGTMSPSMNKGIGMGYVKTTYAAPGTEIYIGIRNKKVKAAVVTFPIYKD
ncbi:MAG: glycine cleavage system aminomethyltransferase GcvT [Bacteroidales bacterium]|nr:glycine cleavage system aminomethyltransferase GcvT [Bacteroidales bacterium]